MGDSYEANGYVDQVEEVWMKLFSLLMEATSKSNKFG